MPTNHNQTPCEIFVLLFGQNAACWLLRLFVNPSNKHLHIREQEFITSVRTNGLCGVKSSQAEHWRTQLVFIHWLDNSTDFTKSNHCRPERGQSCLWLFFTEMETQRAASNTQQRAPFINTSWWMQMRNTDWKMNSCRSQQCLWKSRGN